MIAWPAIVKFAGDDELIYAATPEELNHHSGLRGAVLQAGDVLIDAAGAVYPLKSRSGGLEISDEPAAVLAFEAVIDLVRRHASGCGECCIGKISAPDIATALELVKSLEKGSNVPSLKSARSISACGT